MSRYIKIGEAANLLGVSIQTLRRWEEKKSFLPDKRGPGGTRYYLLNRLLVHRKPEASLTFAYARVSSYDQKDDLKRQEDLLSSYCAAKGWTYEVTSDLGSGMNYRKKGLKKLITAILEGRICRLVITHKDRLLRFGAELIFSLCEAKQVEVSALSQKF